jgi:hypothetical protein
MVAKSAAYNVTSGVRWDQAVRHRSALGSPDLGRAVEINLRKVYDRAVAEGGKASGSYITPENMLAPDQLAYKLSERDVHTAVGTLAPFNPSKGAKRSVADIFSVLPLDPSGKISVKHFVQLCDPLVIVSVATDAAESKRHQGWLSEQNLPPLGVVPTFPKKGSKKASVKRGGSRRGSTMQIGDIPRTTMGKLEKLLEVADPVHSDAVFIGGAGPEAHLDPVESKYSFAPAEFARLLREHALFERFVGPEETVYTIDQIVGKLDGAGAGKITLGAFSKLLNPPAPSGGAAAKKSRKRFHTWGRKKKAKNVDSDLGISTGSSDMTAADVSTKKAMFSQMMY